MDKFRAPSLPPPIFPETPKTQGEREWLRGPLSRDITYRLVVSGEPGPKEIAKLIKLLEAQRAVLADDETAFSIVQKITSIEVPQKEKNPAAVALGRLGGLKGGKARAKSLTPKKRKEIAQKAAKKRWGNA